MDRLIQISDPHFGTERPEVVEALARLVAQQRPGLAVLSGDITQRARRAQFDAARRFVDRIAVPQMLVVPGNHDIPLYNVFARAFDPYGGWRRVFGDDLEPEIDDARWLVLGVKTTRRRRHKDGEVSPEQMHRVAERLRRARPEQLRIVVTHQPVVVRLRRDVPNLLHGAAEAVPCWAEAGCDLILGGHIHLPFIEPLHEHFPGMGRRVWGVQAGTALSHRVREGADNSVNILHPRLGDERRCIVERWDYVPAAAEFRRVSASELGVDR